MKLQHLPIVTLLSPQSKAITATIEHILNQLFPDELTQLNDALPLIIKTSLEQAPCDLHFYLCCKLRENAYRFFYTMIRYWLIPGKEFNVLLQFAADFKLSGLFAGNLTAAQLTIRCDTNHDRELIIKNWPSLLVELKLGITSRYHATRILETKGLSYDEKNTLVQMRVSQLIKYRPQDFDYDLLSDMQRFLVLCKDDFKQQRSTRHLSRVICVHYLFRKALKLSLDAFPNRRYISVKLLNTLLEGSRRVLGIAVGLSYLKEHEVFEARHLLSAVKTYIPDAQTVRGSFYVHPPRSDGIYLLYLEIEKPQESFSKEEMRQLKLELPVDLKKRIELRQNPVFLPKNEEEVIRRILMLKTQLNYVRDLPQVTIDFSAQSEEQIEFLVILLRIKTFSNPSIRHLFELHPSQDILFRFDRKRTVGTLRKKYKKEANVFYLSMNKNPFLRQDHSVDLYKARQKIVQELKQVLGDFRDYNGGSISKEIELFESLKAHLGSLADENHFLLENFFFAIEPPVMRSILPAKALAKLFTMVIEATIEGLAIGEHYQIRMEEEESNYYLLVIADDPKFAKELIEKYEFLDSPDVAFCLIEETELPCFGMICRNHHIDQVQEIGYMLEKILDQKKSYNPH